LLDFLVEIITMDVHAVCLVTYRFGMGRLEIV
jgi:hypothetical protein